MSVFRKRYLIPLSLLCGFISIIVILLRIGYPWHREAAVAVYLTGWLQRAYWKYCSFSEELEKTNCSICMSFVGRVCSIYSFSGSRYDVFDYRSRDPGTTAS